MKQYKSRKAAKYAWLTIFVTFMVVYGWVILRNSEWLPWYLGGKGKFELIFADMPFVEPIEGALTYSYIQTGYRMTELLSHVFLDIPSNDYYESLLHHMCALFLNITMIYSNFLGIGCIINFLHDISEIIAHAAKFFSATKYENALVGLFLLNMVVWFYTRNLVFSYVVYKIWTEVRFTDETATYQCLVYVCAFMLTCLVFLQWYWQGLFINMLVLFATDGSTEDTQCKVPD
jgi:hypothetical protein